MHPVFRCAAYGLRFYESLPRKKARVEKSNSFPKLKNNKVKSMRGKRSSAIHKLSKNLARHLVLLMTPTIVARMQRSGIRGAWF
jgi:hypothetical protein